MYSTFTVHFTFTYRTYWKKDTEHLNTQHIHGIWIRIYTLYESTWSTYLKTTCMHIDSAQAYWFWYRQNTNVASEHALSQKESSLPTTVFQQRTEVQKVVNDTKVNCTPHVFQVQKVSWVATYSPNRRSFGRSISYVIFVRFNISSLEFLISRGERPPSAEGPQGFEVPSSVDLDTTGRHFFKTE